MRRWTQIETPVAPPPGPDCNAPPPPLEERSDYVRRLMAETEAMTVRVPCETCPATIEWVEAAGNGGTISRPRFCLACQRDRRLAWQRAARGKAPKRASEATRTADQPLPEA